MGQQGYPEAAVKTKEFKVERWVLMKDGEFSTDENGAYYDKSLAAAHIFVGRPASTVAVRPQRVWVILDGHLEARDGST